VEDSLEGIDFGFGVGLVGVQKGTMGMPMAPTAVNQLIIWVANPGGILGAAGLLVDPSLPDGQAAKSCIITMVEMHPMLDILSTKQAC